MVRYIVGHAISPCNISPKGYPEKDMVGSLLYELVHALEASGFDPQEGVFFMPAFDGVLSGTSKIPASIRRMAQSISTRFNLRESSWFGSTIAVTAVRKADHRRTGQDSSSG
jgi:hypothetical protein